jgi:rsbT antagonist protein RsbS
VAFAMVQLGLTMEGVATALDLDEGLEYLNHKRKMAVSRESSEPSRG